MPRASTAALWVCLLSFLALAGCGPGLVALGGGSTGVALGLQSSGKDDGDNSAAPVNSNFVPTVNAVSLVREESPARINYILIDPNAEPCTVQIEYSVAGAPYSPCLKGDGGEGTIDLASSAGGVPHVFHWDFKTDIGTQRTTDLSIRMRAHDGKQFGTWFELHGQSIGNDGPVISSIDMIGDTGVLLITFNVADQNSDLASLDIEWSIDQAQNWTPVVTTAEILGNPPVGMLSSPLGSPGQVIWNSGVALSNYFGNVYLKLIPRDQPPGYSVPTPSPTVVAGPFALDNTTNQPPQLQLDRSFSGQTFVSKVPIDFTVWDGESDATALVVSYTLNGTTFFPATMPGQFSSGSAGPFPTSPSPTFFGIWWDALADLQGQAGLNTGGVGVQLRLIPADGNAGTPVLTDQFRVFGNSAPSVIGLSPLNSYGNIPVNVRATDASSDPVSIDIEYSTNGVNFTPLTQADFAYGDLGSLITSPVGEDNLLVWNSTLRFNGSSANNPLVWLRARATDHPVSATPGADLTGDYFVSSSFPVINDPAGAEPISIDIFTTNNGGPTPSSPQYVTVPFGSDRTLNRTVQPTSALNTDTFWTIVEGTGYGALEKLAGGPLDFATGSISPNSPGAIPDAATFTLSDGFNTVVFEFDKAPSPPIVGNVLVNITGATTAADVAVAAASAINASALQLSALAAGSVVTLTHRIACNTGNSTGNGGSAAPIQFTGGCLINVLDLSGGAPEAEVRFVAPASPPPGSDRVTLRCQIDHPTFANVFDTYVLFWGDAPTLVQVSPPTPSVLINGSVNFSAVVQPGNAPQSVTWEVVGGFANGTISISGQYSAPAQMPASNTVTVRAVSVLSSVAGTAQVTLLPEPTSVTVSSQGSVTQLTLSGGTASTLQFFSQVQPAGAPSGVNWRIFWNNSDQGSGNPTVGQISPSGLYTAPQTLPSPNVVQIQALSQVKPSVFGFFNLNLLAPSPTSFQVLPGTALIFANGAGQQFATGNFVPTNANTAVNWEVVPAVGFGTVSSSGFYTPPVTLTSATNVIVRARSAIDGQVFADAIVSLQPPVQAAPTLITISPAQGLTTATAFGPPLQFSSVVAPPQAPQGVNWTIDGVPRGAIDPSGKYSPALSTTDHIEIVRATSSVDSGITSTVEVYVTGSGHGVAELADMPVGRTDATPVWDSQNSRLWYIGGVSEGSSPDHELGTMYYAAVTNQFGFGPNLDPSILQLGGAARSIAAAYENTASTKRIWAFVGLGSNVLRVFRLDVATLPIPTTWTEVVYGGASSDIPALTTSARYPCWYDTTENRIYLLATSNEAFCFNVATGNWVARASLNVGLPVLGLTNAPSAPLSNAFCWRQSTREAYFIGPGNSLLLAPTRVHALNMVTRTWEVKQRLGSFPTFPSGFGSLAHNPTTSTMWLFGGVNQDTGAVHNNLYEIALAPSNATFTLHTAASVWPAKRTRGAMGMTTAASGPILLGGRSEEPGVMADLWRLGEATASFSRFSPVGIRPQGRSHAAGAMRAGVGYVYGGVTSAGTSDELWLFTQPAASPVWSLPATSGANKPPALAYAAMSAPEGSPFVFMFGGTTSVKAAAAQAINDLYVFNTGTSEWTRPSPSGTKPSARFGAAMTPSYTAGGALSALWVFGGEDQSGKLNDIWRLDLSGGLPGAWQALSPTTQLPNKRSGAAMGWDSRRNRLLVVGGTSDVSGANRQYFEFDIATSAWSNPTATNTGADENVSDSGAVYDLQFRRFLHAPSGKPKLQALVVTTVSPTWQYLAPPAANQSLGSTGLFDPVTGRYYALFGDRSVGVRTVGTNSVRWISVK